MEKKKENYSVETKTVQLTDTAVANAGSDAVRTLDGEDVVISNEYRIPFHAVDTAVITRSVDEEEVYDRTCLPEDGGEAHFTGLHSVSIKQGIGIDLTEGVKAYDADGNEIPFTVSPTEIDACDVGSHTVTYTAEGVTSIRTVTITAISHPTIHGLDELTVEVDEEFDPLEGVSAVDGNGKEVEVTVEGGSDYPVTGEI